MPPRRAVKKIVIPASTPGCTVFPYDRISHQFKTAHYTQSLTQGRVTHTEVDQLLHKVRVPVSKWFKEYGLTVERQRLFFWLKLISIILLPLFPLYLCYRSCRKKKAHKKLLELRKNVMLLINANGHSYVQRQLVWFVPTHFPFWIELRDKTHPSYVPTGKTVSGKVYPHPHKQPPGYPQLQPQAYPMQPQGYPMQPHMDIQMMPMQQQPAYGYPGYQMSPGYMVPYSPSGYPMMQGGYQQPAAGYPMMQGGYQQPAAGYGANYYS